MTDKKGNKSIFRQVAIAVIVTLLAGSTAPWWWKEVFPGNSGATNDVQITDSSGSSHRNPQENTADGSQNPESGSETTNETISPEPQLTRHIWVSHGGGTQFLDPLRYPYRVGITHTEDLPPAGKSIWVLSYNLSTLRNEDIVSATIDLSPSGSVGNPFGEIGTLVLEEISAGDASRLLAAPQRRILGRINSVPQQPIDLTEPIKQAVTRAARSFQIRLTFNKVYLSNVASELAAHDTFLEWDTAPSLSVTLRR